MLFRLSAVALVCGGIFAHPAVGLEWPVVDGPDASQAVSGSGKVTVKTIAARGTQSEQLNDTKKDAEAAVSEAKPEPPPVTLQIAIDLTSQRMTVRENGKTKYHWKISSGRSGYLTPTGTYKPQWMARHWRSRKYGNAPMPHSIFFHNGFAIHATYATGQLGRAASHGCIRLSPSNAKTMFGLVSKHGKAATRITIEGHAKQYRQQYAKRPMYQQRRRYQQVPPGYMFSYRRPPSGAYGARRSRYSQAYRGY